MPSSGTAVLSAVPVLDGTGAVPGLWARCHGWYLRDKHGPLGYNAPFLHCNKSKWSTELKKLREPSRCSGSNHFPGTGEED